MSEADIERPVTPFEKLSPPDRKEANLRVAMEIMTRSVFEGATQGSGLFTVDLKSGARVEVPYSFTIGPPKTEDYHPDTGQIDASELEQETAEGELNG